MVDDEETETDDLIDPVVDSTPVLPEIPEMTSAALFAFCNDTAQKIRPYEQIARRYGFVDVVQMASYIESNPMVRRTIKELRSVHFSDGNTETRLRKLTGHAVLAAIPSTADMMFNPRIPESVRIDALKAHARIAGVDGIPASAREAIAAGQAASRFSVQIIFPNAGRTEDIATIEGVEATTVVNDDDEDAA